MIVGLAILPTAPLLVPGATGALPQGVGVVCDAIDAVIEGLPDHDVAVLIAGAAQGSIYDGADATLAAIGRADVTQDGKVEPVVLERLGGLVDYPLQRGAALPLGLAVLAFLVGNARPLVPLAVPGGASFDALTRVGVGVAGACDGEFRAVVVAAGDGAAGLTERSPLHVIEGARDFDAHLVDIVDSGRLEALGRLGPVEAARVGAVGWAPLAVLHGAVTRARIGLVRRHYSAPRGVGYLVAHGA